MKAKAEPPKLGKSIAEIRKKKSISLDELSNRSGVSKGMLSQIEQEKVNPTVAVVWKIAYGLDVPFQDLLVSNEGDSLFNPLHKNDAVILEKDDGRCVFRILSPMNLAEKLEVYTLRIKKGGVLHSQAHAQGTEEFVTVLDGRVTIEVSSKEVKPKKATLEAGDSIHYRADLEHKISNICSGDCNLYMVVRYQG